MIRVPTPTADLSVRDRELLRLATLDPDMTAILSRYVHAETAIGVWQASPSGWRARSWSWSWFKIRAFGVSYPLE